MGTAIRNRALLIVMTMIFAALALDIAIPTVVLSLMALSRSLVVPEIYPVEPKGEAA